MRWSGLRPDISLDTSPLFQLPLDLDSTCILMSCFCMCVFWTEPLSTGHVSKLFCMEKVLIPFISKLAAQQRQIIIATLPWAVSELHQRGSCEVNIWLQCVNVLDVVQRATQFSVRGDASVVGRRTNKNFHTLNRVTLLNDLNSCLSEIVT